MLHEQLMIYRVRLPLPFRLSHVNCYAIKGRDGWSVIDTGLNTEASRNIWQQFMTDQHLNQSDIRGIYITHCHADHVGAAGWLQQLSGAPVYMSAADAKMMTDAYSKVLAEGIGELLNQNGVPPELVLEACEEKKCFLLLSLPLN